MTAAATVTRVGVAGLPALAAALYWTAFRPRSQTFGTFPYRAETTEKVIALTFDDGPNEPFTSRLLDALDHRGVKATFFQVGRCVQRFPSTTRRIVDSGHVLGNHSYSHAFTRYLSQPRQAKEISAAQKVIAEVAGVTPVLYRPPWLCHLPWVLQSVRAQGLLPVSGTFGHPLEVFQPPATSLARQSARVTGPGSIIILHDGREARGGRRDQTVASVGPLIDTLAARGYRFTTVDRLLGIPAYAG